MPILAVGWLVVWRFYEPDTALELGFRFGMLGGLAGVALDYGRRLFKPVLRVTVDGFTGNPIWTNKGRAKIADIDRHEVRRVLGLTRFRAFDHSGRVIYRIWLQPDPLNVAAALRFLGSSEPGGGERVE